MNPFLQTLRNLGPVRLASLAAVALALIAFFAFIGTRLTTPGMALLYGGLDSTDSAAIAAKLQETQVPFEVKGDGTQIYVPDDQVGRIRLAMAGEACPMADPSAMRSSIAPTLLARPILSSRSISYVPWKGNLPEPSGRSAKSRARGSIWSCRSANCSPATRRNRPPRWS